MVFKVLLLLCKKYQCYSYKFQKLVTANALLLKAACRPSRRLSWAACNLVPSFGVALTFLV